MLSVFDERFVVFTKQLDRWKRGSTINSSGDENTTEHESSELYLSDEY